MDQPKIATKSAAVLAVSMILGEHRIAVPLGTFLNVTVLPMASVSARSPAVPTQMAIGAGEMTSPDATDTQDLPVSAFSNE